MKSEIAKSAQLIRQPVSGSDAKLEPQLPYPKLYKLLKSKIAKSAQHIRQSVSGSDVKLEPQLPYPNYINYSKAKVRKVRNTSASLSLVRMRS